MTVYEMKFGAPVICQGEECGTLKSVALDKDSWEVSHLILGPGLLKRERVLPLTSVEAVSDEGIFLATQKKKLQSYPVHKTVDRLVEPESGDPVSEYKVGSQAWQVGQQGMVQPAPEGSRVREEIELGVPANRTTLSGNTPVRSGDQAIGRVSGLSLDRDKCQLLGLRVNPGLLLEEQRVSASLLAEIGSQGVYLKG